MTDRYRLDGPEPPAGVRRVQVGPRRQTPSPYPKGVLFGAVGDVWWRRECRQVCQYRDHRGGRHRTSGHYHWTNGDRSRPWSMIRNRALWDVALDMDSRRPWQVEDRRGWRP